MATPVFLSPLHCLLLLLLFTSSYLPKSQSQSQPVEELEKQILLQLKASWNNPSSLDNWTNTTSHCTNWNGIACTSTTSGPVTAISLPFQDIEGRVPSFICNLKNLSSLDLSGNSIGGAFPTSLYNCPQLQTLVLSQNLFTGPIPDHVDRLSQQLSSLDLSGNNFTGSIPASIANFSVLQKLHLDNNLFNGSFPTEIGNLLALVRLTLAVNPFAPAMLPMEFGKLTKLKYLWMSEAKLIGEIPASFGNLVELELLDLSMNKLTGRIPDGIWDFKNLKILYLYNNNLQGEIPSTIGALRLERIDLAVNQMNGSIPEDFGKMRNLTHLSLYYNQFSGEIPASIGKITTLVEIKLFTNNFTGNLPPDLGKYSKLWSLDVPDNMFSGGLPQSLCTRGNLSFIDVSSNNLSGKIPESLGDCQSLRNIVLSGNRFLGDFPSKIWTTAINLSWVIADDNAVSGELPARLPWNFTRLQIRNNKFSGRFPLVADNMIVFDASNNMFSGELPSDMSRFPKLQELQLYLNDISGVIPTSIGSLSSLTNLNLSRNQLTGEIPATIGSLPALTMLDLSSNHLTSEVPIELGRLRLNILNLSANSLTGEVPLSLQSGQFDRSFISNPGLCAANSILNLPSCTTNSKKSGELSKGLVALILVLGLVVFLVLIVLGLLAMRDIKRRNGNGDLTNWKLTSFQSLGFTETGVVCGLTADNLIGSGGSGEVYRITLGNRTGDREVVAVKKIWNNERLGSKIEKEFQAEVEILGSIRHMNIVKLLCCIASEDSKLLVYEYMENGSLDQWLHGKRWREMGRSGLDWPTRLRIAIGAAQGLCYMHHDCCPAVVHRDIKSSNILLDSELKPKVADFGLARMLIKAGDPNTMSVVAGSFGYMAPECAYARKLNEKVDVYSFGVVLLELVTGKQANNGDGGGNRALAEWVWQQFQEGKPIISLVDREIRDPIYLDEMTMVLRLGLMCTGTLPSSRPSMKVVLHALLRSAGTLGHRDKIAGEHDEAPLLLNKGTCRRGSGNDDIV